MHELCVHHRTSKAQEANTDNDQINLQLKKLFVAATRAKNNLYIETKFTATNSFLKTLLLPSENNETTISNIGASSREDWLDEARVLIKNGCIQQAQAIFEHRLNLSLTDFKQFCMELKAGNTKVATAQPADTEKTNNTKSNNKKLS